MRGSSTDKSSVFQSDSRATSAISMSASALHIGFQAGLGCARRGEGARPATRMLTAAMATISHAQGGSLQRSVGLSTYTVLGYPRAAAC